MYIISHGVLRHILSSCLGVDPLELCFRTGSEGKPYLAMEGYPDLFFNLSHSGSMALAAVAVEEVGVDLERIRTDFAWLDLCSQIFSEAERRELMQFSGEECVKAFFRGWSRKEAFIKAMGGGLSIALDSFSVSLVPDRPEVREVSWSNGDYSCCSMQDIDLGSDYSASIVLMAKACSCKVVRSNPRMLLDPGAAGAGADV